ncbi:hypothetical protein [Mycoplasma sp. Mirounga ES2805-ORL]|uniref:hypothetical protein n=1 Tax=Mycoplasma sp. Mirounga ES2805-ORL TaxID=754514 RepID=UPI00197C85B7|nr:hypothetical protein [Mycoplasma sp. Mirounga ES2805-ORL]QSF13532.1 hypothetical protein JXZ90_02545 [Mycoplasma sp. Mirounga ES2805-ORL]
MKIKKILGSLGIISTMSIPFATISCGKDLNKKNNKENSEIKNESDHQKNNENYKQRINDFIEKTYGGITTINKEFNKAMQPTIEEANKIIKNKVEKFDNLEETKKLLSSISLAKDNINKLESSDKNVEITISGTTHKISEWIKLDESKFEAIKMLNEEKIENNNLIQTTVPEKLNLFNAKKAEARINKIPEDMRSEFANQLLIESSKLVNIVSSKNEKIDTKIQKLQKQHDDWEIVKKSLEYKEKVQEFITESNKLENTLTESKENYLQAQKKAQAADDEWTQKVSILDKVNQFLEKSPKSNIKVPEEYSNTILKYSYYWLLLESLGQITFTEVLDNLLTK